MTREADTGLQKILIEAAYMAAEWDAAAQLRFHDLAGFGRLRLEELSADQIAALFDRMVGSRMITFRRSAHK